VEAQGQARTALRDSQPVNMPSTLMGLLTQIPQSAPAEPPPAPPAPEVPPPGGMLPGRRKRR
jgi:hypothetical protein